MSGITSFSGINTNTLYMWWAILFWAIIILIIIRIVVQIRLIKAIFCMKENIKEINEKMNALINK